MRTQVLLRPQRVSVKRSEFRQSQQSVFRKAKGRTVVVLTAQPGDEEKYLLDKDYFEQILGRLRSAQETLEVMADERLFKQIMRTTKRMDEDIRAGRYYTMDEAFGEA